MAKKSTAIVPTMLRIREDLRKRLEREAKKRDHSLNAEMVERLEQSFIDDALNERELAIIKMMMDSDEISVDLIRKIVRELWNRRSWRWADHAVDLDDNEKANLLRAKERQLLEHGDPFNAPRKRDK